MVDKELPVKKLDLNDFPDRRPPARVRTRRPPVNDWNDSVRPFTNVRPTVRPIVRPTVRPLNSD